VACGSDDRSDDDPIVSSLDFEVDPAEVTFESVSCGSEAAEPRVLTIRNAGGAVLHYELQISDGSPFLLKGEPSGVIALGGTAVIPVSVAPTASGEVAGTLTVVINGVVQQIPLRARGTGASVAAVPSHLDFGEVRFDRVFTRELALRNTGDAPAVIERVDGEADAITLSWPGAPAPLTIAPGGEASLTATIGTGSVTGAPALVTLSPVIGSGHCGDKPTVSIAGLRVNTDVTLSTADFGPQPCGAAGGPTRDVVITNYASTALTYTASLPATSPFTITAGAQGTLAAASPSTETTAAITIGLGPTGTALGVVEEMLTVEISPLAPPDGGARTAKVRLDVRGALVTVTPESATFRSDGKKTDRKTFTFENQGNEQIRLGYAIDARDRTLWSIDTELQDVPAGQTRAVVVGFKAEAKGGDENYSATLEVTAASGVACQPLPQPKLLGEKR
jgi:hypothetical protein